VDTPPFVIAAIGCAGKLKLFSLFLADQSIFRTDIFLFVDF